MYADFLNACANRHDPGADADHDFWYSGMDDDTYGGIRIIGTISTASFAPENGHDDWPVGCVNWYNAYDYCAWAGLNLPEEEHWYKVAGESQGTGAAVSDWYWGNTAPTSSLCNYNDNVGHASDVNDYESNVDLTDDGNVYKAYELTGNVWEWMGTYWYASGGGGDSTPYDGTKGPTAYSNDSSRVVRGGSWLTVVTSWVRAASRDYGAPVTRYASLGFRVARIP
jgi:formylglycine-generating enzyme required for sulfatase activity